MIASVSTRPVRVAAPFWVVLALLGGVAWLVAANEARDMGVGPGTMGMTFPFFIGMWVSMMAAMMLPAIGPQAAGQSLAYVPASVAGRLPGVLGFGAGFLLPWAAYGAVAFLLLSGVDSLVEDSPETARWLGVGILAVAGLYQFTPAKRRALDHCRMALHASGVGSLCPPSFMAHTQASLICPTLPGVISVSGLWLHAW